MHEELERIRMEREILREYAKTKLNGGDYASVIAACVDLNSIEARIRLLEEVLKDFNPSDSLQFK